MQCYKARNVIDSVIHQLVELKDGKSDLSVLQHLRENEALGFKDAVSQIDIGEALEALKNLGMRLVSDRENLKAEDFELFCGKIIGIFLAEFFRKNTKESLEIGGRIDNMVDNHNTNQSVLGIEEMLLSQALKLMLDLLKKFAG